MSEKEEQYSSQNLVTAATDTPEALKILSPSNHAFQEIFGKLESELDTFLKDQFLLGIFADEYKPYAKSNLTYAENRKKWITTATRGYLKINPTFRKHIPLFAIVDDLFLKLNPEFASEATPPGKIHFNDALSALLDAQKELNKLPEGVDDAMTTSVKNFIATSIAKLEKYYREQTQLAWKAIAAQAHTLQVKSPLTIPTASKAHSLVTDYQPELAVATTPPAYPNQPAPKVVAAVKKEQTITTPPYAPKTEAKPLVTLGSMQPRQTTNAAPVVTDPNVKLQKIKIANTLEALKIKVNEYWSASKPLTRKDSDGIIETVMFDMVSELQKWLGAHPTQTELFSLVSNVMQLIQHTDKSSTPNQRLNQVIDALYHYSKAEVVADLTFLKLLEEFLGKVKDNIEKNIRLTKQPAQPAPTLQQSTDNRQTPLFYSAPAALQTVPQPAELPTKSAKVEMPSPFFDLQKIQATNAFEVVKHKVDDVLSFVPASEINKRSITQLDVFIKSEFMLKAFVSKNYKNEDVTEFGGHDASFQERIKAREPIFRETGFSDYQKLFFDNTHSYLLTFYPDDYLVFRQFVTLFETLKNEQLRIGLSDEERSRRILNHIHEFLKPEWLVETDVTKLFPPEKLKHLNVRALQEKYASLAKKEELNVRFLSLLEQYLQKVSVSLTELKKNPRLYHSMNETHPLTDSNKKQSQLRHSGPAASTVFKQPEQHIETVQPARVVPPLPQPATPTFAREVERKENSQTQTARVVSTVALQDLTSGQAQTVNKPIQSVRTVPASAKQEDLVSGWEQVTMNKKSSQPACVVAPASPPTKTPSAESWDETIEKAAEVATATIGGFYTQATKLFSWLGGADASAKKPATQRDPEEKPPQRPSLRRSS